MRSPFTPLLPALALSTLLGACERVDDSPETERIVLAATQAVPQLPPRHLAGEQLGDPIPGLTPAELAAFERGRVLFDKRFTPEEGLGPHYNAVSCASCHSTPVSGGSAKLYRNFYIAVHGFAPLQAKFDELPSPVIPAFGPSTTSTTFTLEEGRVVIPADYKGSPVTVGQRNAIPVFGTGLFEFISNATILANADPFDGDGDGISGRGNFDFGSLGRLGVKAQSNNVERFTRPPLQNQMGITTDPLLGSGGSVSFSSLAVQATGDPDLATDNDGVPDPEMNAQDLGDLIAFARFLAPPQRLPFDAAARRGSVAFDAIGCAKCHIPELDSSLGPIEAYTDLLLHDMGPGLADGLQFGFPAPGSPLNTSEFRTQPLWGVALHAPFLHDGRAATLLEAILEHGGEAQDSVDQFSALSPQGQASIISFLEHL